MKQLMVICAPVTSRSGYGAHSRDLVHSLISMDKYDIKVADVRWGDCPRNALDFNNSNDKLILDRILQPAEQLRDRPDIYIDIRIPSEFQTHGKFNIGITAGIETNVVSREWVEDCNKMDLVIVPSEHSKDGFVQSIYDKVQNLPDGNQQKVGELKLEKSIEVLFEGVDTDVYKPLKIGEINKNILDDVNDLVEEDFAFLMVGQWCTGGYSEDRKDIGRTIKVFIESFANKKKQPALLLKTSGATYSVMDRHEIISKIESVKNMFPVDWKLPNIYLLHGDLSNEEINSLYNHPKIKCMVSFTHGEGFGRPLLEASVTNLPIIASGWSGHIDFLDKNLSLLLPGKVEKVPESVVWDKIIIPESGWFVVDENTAYKALNRVFSDYYEFKNKARSLSSKNCKDFSLQKMTEKFKNIMDKYTSELPEQVELKLPKLKKVG